MRAPAQAGSQVQSPARVTTDVLILAAFDSRARAPLGRVRRSPGHDRGRAKDRRPHRGHRARRLPPWALRSTSASSSLARSSSSARAARIAAPGSSIGDVVVAGRLRLVDPAAIAGTARFPEPMGVAAETDASLANALAALGRAPMLRRDDARDHGRRRSGGADRARAWGRRSSTSRRTASRRRALPAASRSSPSSASPTSSGSAGRAEWLANHRRAEDGGGGARAPLDPWRRLKRGQPEARSRRGRSGGDA